MSGELTQGYPMAHSHPLTLTFGCRYSEGRRLWGSIGTLCRNIAQVVRMRIVGSLERY